MADAGGHERLRKSYDAVATEYARQFGEELSGKPLDRALLQVLIEEAGGGPIADLGCGPGHVAAWLAGRGVPVVGVDLSAQMVAIGGRTHPEVEFRQGDLLALPAGDGELAAAVAFYSIIHLAPGELRPAFSEIHRALRADGLLLVSFHLGTEVRHLEEWWGHDVDIDFHFYERGSVVTAIEAEGFVVEAELERVSYPGEVETRRAYLLGRRDGA